MAATLEQRAKRIIETPLGSRVMLPNFGSKLFELIDKPIDEEYKIRFIAYTHEAFYNLKSGELWDRELEPKQVIFDNANNTELKATLLLSSGEEVIYAN